MTLVCMCLCVVCFVCVDVCIGEVKRKFLVFFYHHLLPSIHLNRPRLYITTTAHYHPIDGAYLPLKWGWL